VLQHHRTFDEKQNFSLHGYLFALTRGGLIGVYISSPAPDSVDRAYHKIWRPVKGMPRPQHLGAGAKPTESEKRPEVNSPTRYVGFYITIYVTSHIRG